MDRENKRLLNEKDIADWVASQRASIEMHFWLYTVHLRLFQKQEPHGIWAMHTALTAFLLWPIQGKYITSPSIAAGTRAKDIAVMDHLVDKIKKEIYK